AGSRKQIAVLGENIQYRCPSHEVTPMKIAWLHNAVVTVTLFTCVAPSPARAQHDPNKYRNDLNNSQSEDDVNRIIADLDAKFAASRQQAAAALQAQRQAQASYVSQNASLTNDRP